MTQFWYESNRAERYGLLLLGVFTLSSISGYGYFALNPQNLPATSFALSFYNISFQFFAQLHILIAFGVLAAALVTRAGFRWIPALMAVYVLSFTSEHIGTGYGIPFGGYEYTGLLGRRLGPRVPALIPLSWFLMALPAFVMARRAFPSKLGLRIGFGALGLVLWDLALDPAMSFLTPYWRWAESGPYYGMPWMNLVGWFATGVVLMGAIEINARRGAFDAVPAAWMAAFYCVVAFLPLGMLAAAGSWLAVATTTLSMAATVGVVAMLGLRERVRDLERELESDPISIAAETATVR